METVRIVINENRELVFVGEQVFLGRSDEFTTDAGTRWLELAVFARKDGGFAPVIFYRSTCESDVTIAEHVDAYKDVENFFYVFEPTEVLDEKKLMALPVEQRQRLTKTLTRLYDEQVNKALLAVRACAAEHPEQDAVREEEKPKKRFFGFFSKSEN